jgi:hypothetical protein
MPVHEEEESAVAGTVPAPLTRSGEEALDLIRRQVLSAPQRPVWAPSRRDFPIFGDWQLARALR